MSAYINYIEKNYTDWKNSGVCEMAVELNNSIGEQYFDESNPHFFTGDLKAELVLVHLNPKRNKKDWGKKCLKENFDDYLNQYASFGKRTYGANSPRTHKSPFDHKQIRFLRPFNLLPFKENDKYHNLETVIDKKLQLELVPYGSPNFDFKKIGLYPLKSHFENVLREIGSKKRKYVIFCGRVFEDLLSHYITNRKDHSFKLVKNNGETTQSYFNCINIQIKLGDVSFNACVAPQFAKQGYPVERYGEKIKELYGQYQ